MGETPLVKRSVAVWMRVLPPLLEHRAHYVELMDGSSWVFDPWRDRDNPIWDASHYEMLYGTLYLEGTTTPVTSD